MADFFYPISGALVLIIAVSLDAFVASIAYGSNHIRIRPGAAVIISGIGSLFLGFSVGVGSLLGSWLSEESTQVLGFLCLFLLGIIKLLDYNIKAYINRHKEVRKDISFSISQLHFLLSIYGDPIAADKDESRTLSLSESLFLAAAMSIDSLVAGIGAAFLEVSLLTAISLSFTIGLLAVWAGCRLGNGIAGRARIDLSWLSGLLLVILALMKLL